MRVFKVPFDSKREEKIFGGYLSLRQVLYLMLGAIIGIIFIPAIKIHIIFKVLIFTIFASLFLCCAFLKIGEQNFDKILTHFTKYIFKKKKIVYKGVM